MAKSFSHCTIEAKKAFDEFTPDELEEFTQLLDAKRGGVTPGAFKRLVETMAVEQISNAQTFKHSQIMNTRARVNLTRDIMKLFPNDTVKGLRSFMVGTIKHSENAALAQRQGTFEYLSSFRQDLNAQGLTDVMISKVHDQDIMRVLDIEGKGGTLPEGLSPNAIKLAHIIKKWNDRMIDDANRMGATIKYDPSYIMRQSHDEFSIRKASEATGGKASVDPEVNYKAWRNHIVDLLDHEKTFKDAADPEKFLRSVFDALSSGVHLTHPGSNMSATMMKRLSSAAKQMSNERILHFKDGEAFYQYNSLFGTRGVLDSVVAAMENTANSIGLMRYFGPNARDNYEQVFEGFMHIATAAERKKLQSAKTGLDSTFDTIDGSDRMPANVMIAQRTQDLLALQNITKLGTDLAAAMGDVVLKAQSAWRNGVPWYKAYGDQLLDAVNRLTKAEIIEVNSMVGVATDSLTNRMFSRYGDGSTKASGLMTKMNNMLFSLSYVRQWTEWNRGSHTKMMARHMAQNAPKSYADMNTHLRHELKKYGIEENEWNVIRKAMWKDPKGIDLVVPEKVKEASNVDIDPLIKEDIENIRSAAAEELGVIANKQGRINTRLEKRVAKFQKKKAARLKALAKHKKQLDATAKKGEAGARLQIAKLETQTEIATLDSEMATHIAGEKSETQIRAYIDAVEEGAANVEGAPRRQTGPKASRAVFRLSDTVQKQADALGRRKGKAQAKIQEINRKIKSQKTDTANRQDARSKKTFEAIDRELDELAQLSVDLEADFKQTRIHADTVARRVDERIETAREIGRDTVESKYRQYLINQADDGVINPDASIQATMKFRTKPGTVANAAVRIMTQFKHVPAAIGRQVIGKTLFGGSGRIGLREFEGIAHMFVMGGLFGYLSLSLSGLAKGKSLRAPENASEWWELTLASWLKGGSMGIYGDFLLGEMKSRYGSGALATLAGPTLASGAQIADMWASIITNLDEPSEIPDELAPKAARFAQHHTPFANIWYARAAMDYLIFHNLREMASPGYLKRTERLIEKESAQSYIISPSKVVPRGGTLNPLEIPGNIVEEVGDIELADFVGRN